MLSGSSLMSLVFCEKPEYDDFDLYFKNKSNKRKAIKLLNASPEYTQVYKSKYAITYLHKATNKKLQIILLLKKSLYHLAMSHDFANCTLAYSSKSKNLYVSKKAIKAWTNKEIFINKSPLQNKTIPDKYYFNTYCILLERIEKYKGRYGLSLKERGTLDMDLFEKKCKQRASKYPEDYWFTPIDYSGATYAFAHKLFKK